MYDGKKSSIGPDGNLMRGFSKHGLRAALSSMTYHRWHDTNHELADIRSIDLIIKTALTRSKSLPDLHKV